VLIACLIIPPLAFAEAPASEDGASADELRIGTGDPVAGRKKVQLENCQECHGITGVSSSPSFPKLSGQYAEYIIKQLKDFQSGKRKHPVMSVMSEGLTEDDVTDIAAYFASNPIMQGISTGGSLLAKDIFTRGDMTRNILPCQSCHGEAGKGKTTPTETRPAIGGQHRIYLREQLRNWRSGERSNSPNGVMNIIAKFLSDEEIEALALYISGL
jgi:cytochrome c553